MSQKKMTVYPQLRDTFKTQLQNLLEGVRLLIQPTQCRLSQLSNNFQKLLFEFIHYMIEKNFGLILIMSKKEGDASFFSYTLSIVSEGLQST